MRMNLKNKYRSYKVRRLFFIFLFLLAFIALFFTFSNKLTKLFLEYAKGETYRYATSVINNSVTDELLNNINDMNLFSITKDSNGNIQMVDYDTLYVNIFLKDVTEKLEEDIRKIENGDLRLIGKGANNKHFFTIRLGEVLQNPFFNFLGKEIGVNIKMIGAIETNVYTELKEYGINNSLIEMGVFIKVNIKVMLPVITDNIIVTNKVPISYKIVTGKVPDYYGSRGESSNIFSIPIE